MSKIYDRFAAHVTKVSVGTKNAHFSGGRLGCHGVSMTETMITLTIFSLIAGWGFLTYQNSMGNQQLQVASDQLITVLNTARAEAVRERSNVTICSRGQAQASPQCGEALNWDRGWVIFFDKSGNALFDGEDELILETESLADQLEITFNSAVVTYSPRGFIVSEPGTFVICDGRGDKYARAVRVMSTGSIFNASDSDKDTDFIPEDGRGVNVQCGTS